MLQTFSGGGADFHHIHKGQIARFNHLSQVGFVNQRHRVFPVTDGINDGFILLGQRLRAVANEDHHVRMLCGLAAAFYADGFHRVRRFPNAGGVNKPQLHAAHFHHFLHRISGGAGNVGNDHPVVAGQGV